jgi:hypothetical protein
VRLYALVEAGDPETIDLFLTHEEIERAGANRVDQGRTRARFVLRRVGQLDGTRAFRFGRKHPACFPWLPLLAQQTR